MAKVVTQQFTEKRYYYEPKVYIIGQYCSDVSFGVVFDLIERIRKEHPGKTLLNLTITYNKRKDGLGLEYKLVDDDSEYAYSPYYHWQNEVIRIHRNSSTYYLDSCGKFITEEYVAELEERWRKASDEYDEQRKHCNSYAEEHKVHVDFEWCKSKKGE